jgi:hypothetical protein
MIPGLTDKVMDWEEGKMTPEQEVEFFADLIKSGLAWRLQGMYGRRARDFIEAGLIDRQGKIDWHKVVEAMNEG